MYVVGGISAHSILQRDFASTLLSRLVVEYDSWQLVRLLHGVSLHRTSTKTTDYTLLLHQSHSGGTGGVVMTSQKGQPTGAVKAEHV